MIRARKYKRLIKKLNELHWDENPSTTKNGGVFLTANLKLDRGEVEFFRNLLKQNMPKRHKVVYL